MIKSGDTFQARARQTLFPPNSFVRYNWLRNRNTIEFLGIWEQVYNPAFKPVEFDRSRAQAGLNRFTLSPKKWVDTTDALGTYAKSGRGGGTDAHKDIAFEFGSWLSPEFKLDLIKEFQRLKDEESRATSLARSFQRTLAKVNCRIHTDAIPLCARAPHSARIRARWTPSHPRAVPVRSPPLSALRCDTLSSPRRASTCRNPNAKP